MSARTSSPSPSARARRLVAAAAVASVAFALLLADSALSSKAVSAQSCTDQDPNAALQYLRRLSLDLRGHVPTVAELELVAKAGDVPEDLIDKMIASPQMLRRLRAYHRDLLWTSLSKTQFTNARWIFTRNRDGKSAPMYIENRVGRYGRSGSCPNKPAVLSGSRIEQDGYVMVTPYWNPKLQLRVCAHDAQTRASAGGERCATEEGSRLADCGCGPNLRWCQSDIYGTRAAIRRALAEQMLQVMHKIVAEGRPYSEVLTTREVVVNGPLSHYLRYQTGTARGGIYVAADQAYPVPAVAFHLADKWVGATREASHAGILTLPGYLLRFPTNRGRANRFYNAFLCTEFQGPKDGLPLGGDACNAEPDLQQRCGCKVCHKIVEPAAAHWGRWAEAGFAPLRPTLFPEFSKACATGSKEGNCELFYLYQASHDKEKPFVGKLRPYVFATDEMKRNIARGPIAIAEKAIKSGAFSRCTVRKLWRWLLGQAPLEQQKTKVEEIAGALREGNYRVLRTIKSIVTSMEYRRASLLGQ